MLAINVSSNALKRCFPRISKKCFFLFFFFMFDYPRSCKNAHCMCLKLLHENVQQLLFILLLLRELSILVYYKSSVFFKLYLCFWGTYCIFETLRIRQTSNKTYIGHKKEKKEVRQNVILLIYCNHFKRLSLISMDKQNVAISEENITMAKGKKI